MIWVAVTFAAVFVATLVGLRCSYWRGWDNGFTQGMHAAEECFKSCKCHKTKAK